ncbi:MAG: hypothetical protein ACE5NA_10840 [Nitrospiraceae bacterium]
MKPKHLANSTAGFSLVHGLFTLVQILLVAAGIIVLRDQFGLNFWIAAPLGVLLGLVVMWGAVGLLFHIADRIGSTKNKLS